jgi:hypothetical protein
VNDIRDFNRAIVKALGLEGAGVKSLDLHIRVGQMPTADATLLVRDEERAALKEVAAHCVFEAFIEVDTSDMDGAAE